MEKQTIAEALRESIRGEMRRDERVFCTGEHIAIPGGWGGAFTVTLGLAEGFADRVLNTPTSENGCTGVALGASLMGMRPIQHSIPVTWCRCKKISRRPKVSSFR